MKTSSLTNIGKSLSGLLAEIGIDTAEEFLKHDPEELYLKLEKTRPGLHLAVLASFYGAQSNTPWYFIYPTIKRDFLKKKKSSL